MGQSSSGWVYELLTSEDDGRACRDIPESACAQQPGSFLQHVVSLTLTKAGDGLANPKLTLAWLLTALGAPAGMVGLLVPVREAGSLLPQLITAGTIRAMPVRKWAWVAGSVVQGLAVLGMAVTALTLEGTAAGWTLLGLLALLATARSVSSVSYKDVLGKTVSKATRGTATGAASTLAAAVVLVFGLLITGEYIPLTVPAIAAVLFTAAGCWLVAAAVFSQLREEPGATEGGRNALAVAWQQVGLLRTDPPLVRFILTRALLTATALAPPYLLALSGQGGSNGLGSLGPFVIASALASLTSAYIWGRLADRSSRKVLLLSGALGACVLGTAATAGAVSLPESARPWVFPALLFVLMIAHEGVRLGRATHIVDMATEETRASYTALSNTVIGLLLLLAGGTAVVAQHWGYPTVLALFAVMAAAASVAAHTLDEVQNDS